ncbi:MAG: hypothetical protein QOI94_687 [Acidobacteriaceae bacterium]|nr:hypothetical protein [Acidobacteriaceae bacterium]
MHLEFRPVGALRAPALDPSVFLGPPDSRIQPRTPAGLPQGGPSRGLFAPRRFILRHWTLVHRRRTL